MGCGWSSWPPSATRRCSPRSWSRPWASARRPGTRGARPRPPPSAWPASSVTRRCWWSWTTVSTWSGRARSWPGGCSGLAPGSGSWPPAARSWECPARPSGRSRPWRSPTPPLRGPAPTPPRSTPRAPRNWAALTRYGCSWSGRPPPTPASPWTPPMRPWWPSCAGGWTGCRWPSSWPRPGSGPWPRPRSRSGWMTGSGCWPGVAGPGSASADPAGDHRLELGAVGGAGSAVVAAAGGVLWGLDGGRGRGGLRRRRLGCWWGAGGVVRVGGSVAGGGGGWGTGPVRLLESLRAYGAERLAEAGEIEAVEARHTGWFLDLAEQAAAHRTGRRWLRMVAADYDNLRAVLDRAVAAPDPDTALRLTGALRWYWWTTHTVEGRQRLLGSA